jgi:hypothetical protein
VTDQERAKLQVELVDATADFRTAIVLRDVARERVVRLSRALVSDVKLTDEEALKKAFPEALEATLRAGKKGA